MTMLQLETDPTDHCCRLLVRQPPQPASAATISAPKPSNTKPSFTKRTSATLRSNLLHKLGIPPTESSSSSSPLSNNSQKSILGDANVKRVPLKKVEDYRSIAMTQSESTHNDCHLGDHTSSGTILQALGSLWLRHSLESTVQQASSPTNSYSSRGMSIDTDTGRHVHFDSDVTVVSIPTRYEYSQRMRQLLWNSPDNMRIDIVRNTIEFTADGWDWESAVEEEDHHYNALTHEYIHPVHLEIAQMPLEDQNAILPPNYINPSVVRQQRHQPSRDDLSGFFPLIRMPHESSLGAASTTMPHPIV